METKDLLWNFLLQTQRPVMIQLSFRDWELPRQAPHPLGRITQVTAEKAVLSVDDGLHTLDMDLETRVGTRELPVGAFQVAVRDDLYLHSLGVLRHCPLRVSELRTLVAEFLAPA